MTTATTPSALAACMGTAEDIATVCERASLVPCALNISGIGRPSVSITLQYDTTAQTIRAARLLFGTYNPPAKSGSELLTYEGDSAQFPAVTLRVFGPLNR